MNEVKGQKTHNAKFMESIKPNQTRKINKNIFDKKIKIDGLNVTWFASRLPSTAMKNAYLLPNSS